MKLSIDGQLRGLANSDALRKFLDDNPNDYQAPAPAAREISTQDRQHIKFFSKSAPCWFEGCEELREEYAEEIAALEAKTGCKAGCNKAPIMEKYLKRVAQAVGNAPSPT